MPDQTLHDGRIYKEFLSRYFMTLSITIFIKYLHFFAKKRACPDEKRPKLDENEVLSSKCILLLRGKSKRFFVNLLQF